MEEKSVVVLPDEFVSYTSKERIFCLEVIDKIIDFEDRNINSERPLRINRESVLLFPPLIPRIRYLIHRCVQLLFDGNVQSVSIGLQDKRRVVVYSTHKKQTNLKKQQSPKQIIPVIKENCIGIDNSNFCCKSSHSMPSSEPNANPNNSSVKSRPASKRPDRGVYVPKHMRRSTTESPVNSRKKVDSSTSAVLAQKKNVEKQTNKSKKVDTKGDNSNDDMKSEKVNFHSHDHLHHDVLDNCHNKKDDMPQKVKKDDHSVKDEISTNRTNETNKLIDRKIDGNLNENQKPCVEPNIFQLELFSESLACTLTCEAIQTVGERNNVQRQEERQPQPQVLSNEQKDFVLPGMATNFVNTAIENAMEMLKAMQTYEKKMEENKMLSKETSKAKGIDFSSEEKLQQTTVSEEKDGKKSRDNVYIPPSARRKTKKKMSTKEFNEKQKFYMQCVQAESRSNEACSIEAKMSTSSKRLVKVYKDDSEKEEPINGLEKAIDVVKSEKMSTEQNDSNICESTEDTKDDWDSNFADDGECLNDEMKKELSSLTGLKDPVIEKPDIIDYLDFRPTKDIELDEGESGHIIELFDFSPVLKTQDLFNALKATGVRDYNITWVDDTHALAVFSSMTAAHNAIKQYTPILQMRQVINGSIQSKRKAKEFKDALLPYKRRPVATASVARNLITGALGIRSQVSAEQRNKERRLLKEAREQKRHKAKQQKDIWDNPT